MHSAMVSYEGEKMSKSLGNLVFVSDLLKVADPRAIRLALLRHHYRHGFEWFDTDLEDGSALLHRLLAAAERPTGPDPRPYAARVRPPIPDHRPGPVARAPRSRGFRQRVPLGWRRPAATPRAGRARRLAGHRPRTTDPDRVMSNVTITLPDGSSREYESGTTGGDVAASIGKGL